ncbi:MAG: UDP-3-O-acyl-N-acetylglucosamine deacetylase [Armatimonadota bacterium]|nr:UDP-3-O-acyl-N-acetylglucosamine deacetylase [bacterium]
MNVFKIESSEPVVSEKHSDAYAIQMTLRDSVTLSGTGLHSGRETSVAIHPAEPDTGIVLTDGTHSVPALASNVVDTSRGTSIGLNGDRVRTVEHLMSALSGMGVDNAVVEVNGPEMPALDGSARLYVDAIQAAGLVGLEAARRPVVIDEPIYVHHNGSFILAVPAPHLSITYVLDYDHPLIGSQTASYIPSENDFAKEIAPARTFVLYEEVAALLNDGLSRGGSIENVIVIWQDRMSSDLRFPDELARHKIMDMVGDIFLCGGALQADVLAVKSGHTLNVEFAKEVERVRANKAQGDLF